MTHPPDVVELASARRLAEAVAALRAAIDGAGLTVFATIDHAAAAADAGLRGEARPEAPHRALREPRSTAASCTVSSSHRTLVRTQARRWSVIVIVIVIVSLVCGD